MSARGPERAEPADLSEELELWRRAEASADPELRGQLVERYLPLCRAIAASLYARRVADDAEFADYMQYATLGLIEAVDSYDWRRGVRFNTFATYRIQGAIRNSIVNFSERREQLGLAYRLKRGAHRLDQASRRSAGKDAPARRPGARNGRRGGHLGAQLSARRLGDARAEGRRALHGAVL